MQGFLFLEHCDLRLESLNFANCALNSNAIQHRSLAKLLILKYNLTLIEKSKRLGVANA